LLRRFVEHLFLSVTYTTSWEECDGSTEWFWKQFVSEATKDNFGPLPIAAREQFGWLVTVRKEANSLRVILYEKNSEGEVVSTPEDTGTPICHFYGPKLSSSRDVLAWKQSKPG
jgi:hypothetical protein